MIEDTIEDIYLKTKMEDSESMPLQLPQSIEGLSMSNHDNNTIHPDAISSSNDPLEMECFFGRLFQQEIQQHHHHHQKQQQ